MTDNTTAKACINKHGSTKSEHCNKLVRQIWNFAKQRNIWLSANFCPGVLNVEADTASRVCDEQTEWTHFDQGYQEICEKFGVPTIDLFASRLNHKVDRYCAWEPDPGALYIDALMFAWSEEKVYAFPPFAIVHLVLQKLIIDRTEGIIVAPYWVSKPWFTLFQKLLIAEPLIIPVDSNELFLPFDRKLNTRQQVRHPMTGKLRLIVGLCSGKAWNRPVLDKKQQKLC